MKPTILAMTALGLLLAACGEPATPAAVTPPAPEYANNWYAAEGQTPGGVLNIHETKLGLAGFVREPGGEFQPIRKVVLTDGAMSFIVPALDATWEAAKAADGSWTGKWTTGARPQTSSSNSTVAPEVSSKFVTFEDGRWTELSCREPGAPTIILDYGAGARWPSGKMSSSRFPRSHRPACSNAPAAASAIPARCRATSTTLSPTSTPSSARRRSRRPVVLVGHSMASYHVRQFANLHGDDTAGIVLIDPSGDGQTARFTELIPNIKELDARECRRRWQAAAASAHCAKILAPHHRTAPEDDRSPSNAVATTRIASEQRSPKLSRWKSQHRRDQGRRPTLWRPTADRPHARRL